MSRSRLVIEFPDRPPYSVRIGSGLAAAVGPDLRKAGVASGRCLVICDADSSRRCLPALRESLGAVGFRVSDAEIPDIEPDDAWACIGELHRAVAGLALPPGTPLVVCAGVQASEVAAFAAATYGELYPLVVVPASMAAAFRLVGVDDFELDAGHPAPVSTPASTAYAVIDVDLLECTSEEEADLGLFELAQASQGCDGEYARWQSEHAQAIASYDEDACVLALTQVLAARADALGGEIAERIAPRG